MIDLFNMHFRTVEVKKDPHCPVCGKAPQITALREGKLSN